MSRAVTTFLALMTLSASVPAGALAISSADPNSVRAENRRSGASILEYGFAVRRVHGQTVDEKNLATAYSSCEGCRTVAIAFQVVIVTSANPSVINPTNVPVAVNESCTSCATFAAARQFVVGNGGPVRFTPAGRAELRRIELALADLNRRFESGEVGVPQVKGAVDELTARVRRTLRRGLVSTGRPGAGRRGPVEDLDDRGRPRGEASPVPLPPGLDDEAPAASP